MDFLKKIPAVIKNKYLLTLIAFVAWIVFFDHNDLFLQMERSSELRQLEKGKQYYSTQIEEIKEELSGLKTEPASLEKAARERFMMKRDNEDLFIIEEE